jgi:16S rRNA U1498 N3-methylase RsmE
MLYVANHPDDFKYLYEILELAKVKVKELQVMLKEAVEQWSQRQKIPEIEMATTKVC